MNFFERQDQARRATRRLIALFIVAVLAVVIAIDALVYLGLAHLRADETGGVLPFTEWAALHPGTLLITTAITLSIIGIASLYKSTVLGGGGGVVARSLGGVRVSADTTDPQQRRLLNVVEEMAIASGVPMPEVYLLEQETGINAFAAGHNPSNAAIGVTRGAITTLNRAELQGVIAHEFSHVLNGDMRLNVRLMGLLFGLLVIALIGRIVLRGARNLGGEAKKAAVVVVLGALAMVVVGHVGLFFGRLIQAAVSRRREALADASAVQFTRDPSGLRGALLKIGAVSSGSRIANPEVDEVAHMLFAPGMRRLFATHPSLNERLKALDPHFDPKEIDKVRARLLAEATAEVETEESRSRARSTSLEDLVNVPATAALAGLVGNPGTLHMQFARSIRTSLPEAITLANRSPGSARALLLALALDRNAEARTRQLAFIGKQLGEEVARAAADLAAESDRLEGGQRMPALLRAFPVLRQLPRDERMQLMSCLNGMLQREGTVSLHAYVLRKLSQVHLRDDLAPIRRAGHASLESVAADLQLLFSVLARHGHRTEEEARRAYEAGMHRLLPHRRPEYTVAANWAGPLDVALSRLDGLAPVGKEQLLAALVNTVTHDTQLTVGEAELLRAICAALHCPLPPFLADT